MKRFAGARRYLSPLRVASFLVGVIVLAVLLRQVDFAELARLLLHARAEWLVLGGFAYLIKSMVRAQRITGLFNGVRPRYLAILRLTLASSLAGQLLPFKLGELTYVYLMRRELKSSISQGVSSLMIIRVLDLLAIALLFILAAAVFGLPASFSVYLSYIIGFVALLLVLLTAAALALRLLPSLAARAPGLARKAGLESMTARLEGWLGRRSPRVQQFAAGAVNSLRGSAARLAETLRAYQGRQAAAWLGLALIEWLVNLVVYHALLLGIGLSPHPFDTAAAVTFAALASVLPINSLGSFGSQEAGWATGLILLGYDASTAITSGFATHLLQLGYMLLLGGFSWVTYLLARRSAADPAPDARSPSSRPPS